MPASASSSHCASSSGPVIGLFCSGIPASPRRAVRPPPDGSYRYSKRYAVTPVWVTAQVLPALAGKPFPLS